MVHINHVAGKSMFINIFIILISLHVKAMKTCMPIISIYLF